MALLPVSFFVGFQTFWGLNSKAFPLPVFPEFLPVPLYMGFLQKTLYTIIGLPTIALVAEYFYTIKCVEVDPTDRLPKYSSLVSRRLAENAARLDRFERVVPLPSLKSSVGSIDEITLSRQFAKQIWLTPAYTPQRLICEQVFKSKRDPNANLTKNEIEKAKVQIGFNVSQFFLVDNIIGSYVQFTPNVPPSVDFRGPGGLVCVDVCQRGESIVFGIECATVGLNTRGTLPPTERLHFWLHQMYCRLLLEGGVRRILRGTEE